MEGHTIRTLEEPYCGLGIILFQFGGLASLYARFSFGEIKIGAVRQE